MKSDFVVVIAISAISVEINSAICVENDGGGEKKEERRRRETGSLVRRLWQ